MVVVKLKGRDEVQLPGTYTMNWGESIANITGVEIEHNDWEKLITQRAVCCTDSVQIILLIRTSQNAEIMFHNDDLEYYFCDGKEDIVIEEAG